MAAKHITDAALLQNGVKMPWLGLGVWKTKDGSEVEQAVHDAFEAGYRHIDTATLYKNETGVGKAIRESGITREDLFVTTKVWNIDQGYNATLHAFEESKRKLGLDYIDLYLIHWPVQGKFKETWRALEHLYQEGFVRAIGVSNFQVHHLKVLLQDSKVKPMVNQVECHPMLTQLEVKQFCQTNHIQVEAWSPIMKGNLDNTLLVELSKKYEKSPAQIVLRWHLQNGVIVIPKSVHKKRIVENADIFGFELSTEDMDEISWLNQNKRFGQDPDNFEF